MTDICRKMKDLRKRIVEISYANQEGHIPSAFSILDIMYVLCNDVMDIDPTMPLKEPRDRLIVSKGHASIGIYTILADRGFIPEEELKTFGKFNSRLGGHPDFRKVPGIEVSTGSLGHGLPLGVGLAMGLKFKGSKETVYVIVGDGELNEGTNWEAALVAKEQNLDNLVCIVDYNHSSDRAVNIGDIEEKFRCFGWDACSVDGHNHAALINVLLPHQSDKPRAVVANTIKGFGCNTMTVEYAAAWHHRSPNKEEYVQVMEELEKWQ